MMFMSVLLLKGLAMIIASQEYVCGKLVCLWEGSLKMQKTLGSVEKSKI